MLRSCRSTVASLLARHQWHLLDSEEFVQRTFELVQVGTISDPQRAATYTYSLALYNACSGIEGEQRRNTGYTELHRYLYDAARWRNPDTCEEAAQLALVSVFHRFERCRQPAAFLAFALQRLMDSIQAIRRQADRDPITLEPPDIENDMYGDNLPDTRQLDPLDTFMAGELGAQVKRCLSEFLRRHPRASQQLAALTLKYLNGLDDLTISHKLGTTVKNVYVLRSRAIDKLKVDQDWQALADEYGIRPEELELNQSLRIHR